MSVDLKNKYFVGTRGLYGSNSVKYQNMEMEVPSYEYDFSDTKNSFDWGTTDQGATLLASAILKKIATPTVARVYANKFTNSVISNLKDDTWELAAIDVAKWVNKNTDYKIDIVEDDTEDAKRREAEAKEQRRIQREKEFQEEIQRKLKERSKKAEAKKNEAKKNEAKKAEIKKVETKKTEIKKAQVKKVKPEESEEPTTHNISEHTLSEHNIIDQICLELEVGLEDIAEILNMPLQLIKDWRLENEMPKMAKKAMEFYRDANNAHTELQKIQETKEKTNSDVTKYKTETTKCKAEITKLKAKQDKDRLEIDKYKKELAQQKEELSAQKSELNKYKKFVDALDIPSLYKKFNSLS